MNNNGKLKSNLLLIALFSTILISCNDDQSRKIEEMPSADEKEMVEVEGSNAPQFEEVLPDSIILENINPEDIITDDWNSDSPDAAAHEED